MTVQLAPIRTTDLRAGDVLIGATGDRFHLAYRTERMTLRGWLADRCDETSRQRFISDVAIDRTGPDRRWWLDSCVERP